MKRFLILSFFLTFLSSAFSAQKTLQFSQVKLVTGTSQTVPAGHVWKIENIGSGMATMQSPGTTVTPAILVNGNKIYFSAAKTSNSSDFLVTASSFFPIWLPAGTTLAASNQINFISVVEYAEVP